MSFPSPPDQESPLLLCLESFQDSSPPHLPGSWAPLIPEYLNLLKSQDPAYSPDVLAFTRQKDLTVQIRATLVDWLMELSSKFFLKRETVYLAISHLDRLASRSKLSRADLQLLGVTCLHLASKSEEVTIPKLCHLLKAANVGRSSEIVLKLESWVLKSLDWQMYPVTYVHFMNTLLVEWDIYISSLYRSYILYVNALSGDRLRQQDLLNKRLITFKQENTYSYRRFREVMQVLDACMLDFGVYQFEDWKLAAGVLYVACNKSFFSTGYELLWWNSLVFGLEGRGGLMVEQVHLLLERFLCAVFKLCSLDGLTACLGHLSKFVELQFEYELPVICKVMPNVQENYENFLGFQTYCKHNKVFVSKYCLGNFDEEPGRPECLNVQRQRICAQEL